MISSIDISVPLHVLVLKVAALILEVREATGFLLQREKKGVVYASLKLDTVTPILSLNY